MKIRSFDVLAPFYDVFMSVFRRRIPWKIMSFIRSRNMNVVLDAGGGTGYNSARIKRMCRRVVVLDISFEMLRHAKKYSNLDLVQGDARMLPFKNGCFDAILAVDCIHHIGDYTGVLKEAKRTGKDTLFVAEFFGRTPAGRLFTGLEQFFMPVVYKSPEDFCAEAARQGIPGRYKYISGFEYFFKGNMCPDPLSNRTLPPGQ